MDEDLLVFLEPRIQGIPIEPHRAGEAVERVLRIEAGAARPRHLTDTQPVP